MTHPFELSTSQLVNSLSLVDNNGSPPPPTNNPALPVTTTVGEETGTDNQVMPTSLAIGAEGGATTEALGEEGGMTPIVMPPGEPTSLAIGAEGGNEIPIPVTGAIGETGDIIPLPTTRRNIDGTPTTLAIGEEGGNITEAFNDLENGGDVAIPTTLAIGEEGGISEPMPTTLAIGEEGGNAPVPTTALLGEEGGIVPIGFPPQVPITPPIGEEVSTLAVGEEGGIFTPIDNIDNRSISQPNSAEISNFNQEIYQQTYPNINAAINSGEFNSAVDHYIQFGQFEAERIGFFTGSDDNDIITSFGNNTKISGVNSVGYNVVNERIIPLGLGVGEIDILVGNTDVEGVDEFILGIAPNSPFYVGFNNFDFATIKNFDVAFDRIKLPGVITDYSFEIVNDSVNVATATGDLIGIIENVASVVEDINFIFDSSSI